MLNMYNYSGGVYSKSDKSLHIRPWLNKMNRHHAKNRLSFILGLAAVCFGMTGCLWDDTEYRTYVQTEPDLGFDYVSFCPYGVMGAEDNSDVRYVNLDKGVKCYADHMQAMDDIYIPSSGKNCDLIKISDNGEYIYRCELMELSSDDSSNDVVTVDSEVESYLEKVKFRYKNIVRMCLAYQNHQEIWGSDNPAFELKFVWSDQNATQSIPLENYSGMTKGNVCPADYSVCYANGREFGCIAKQCDACTGDNNPPGAELSTCITQGYNSGLCEILKCKTGYYLNRNTNECIKNTPESCGDIYGRHWENCMMISNVKDVSCTDEGLCKVESCESNYHPNSSGTKCEADTNTRCGASGEICDGTKNFICLNGKCICKPGYTKCTDTCVDLNNDKNHCNACDITCDYACVNGTCVCDVDSYMDFVNDGHRQGKCLPSDDENCGVKGKVCTTDDLEISAHVKNVACNTSTSKCEATECNKGYHVYNGICERDNIDNCGEHDRVCNKSVVSYGVAFVCEDGLCKATKCMNGYQVGNTEEDSGLCVPETSTVCGKHYKECQKSDIEGSRTVACKSGRCQATSCQRGYHLVNGYCLEDGPQGCGSLGVICSKASVYKSTATQCVDGKCVATECEENYHLYNGICELNTVENCSEHARVCSIENSAERSCTDGICRALSCKIDRPNQKSYHPYTPDTPEDADGQCELDTVDNCGVHGYCCLKDGQMEGSDCESSREFLGSTKVGCNLSGVCEATACITPYYHKYKIENTTECELNDNVNCGAHGVACTTSTINYSTEVDCTEGTCHPMACIEKYHIYDVECEENTVQNCGSHGNNCNAITYSTSTSCNAIDGICVVNSCSSGHTYNPTGSDGMCEADTATNCGSHGHNCNSITYSTSTSCNSSKKCVVNSCSSGHPYNPSGQEGICEANSNTNCGSHGTSCTTSKVSNSSTVSCSTGTCKASTCKSGYHVYSGTCETNTASNCGSHGNKCSSITYSTSTSCTTSTGLCVVSSCSSGHPYNPSGQHGMCESNTTSNCGSHGTTCSKSNSTGVSCSTGTCKATGCKSGYHLYSNNCEADDTTNCGSHGTPCTKANSTGVTCSSGTCEATGCEEGYTLSSGSCVASEPDP